MLTHEETCILRQLYRRGVVAAAALQARWGQRVLRQLEWLGYVVIYSSPEGQPLLLELTQKGTEYLRQALDCPKAPLESPRPDPKQGRA
jgi:hypothetical protein